MRAALHRLISQYGVAIRLAEFALIVAFFVAAWTLGGDMFLAAGMIVMGVLVGLFAIATAPNLTDAQKYRWSGILLSVFIGEAGLLNWHAHPKETELAVRWVVQKAAPYRQFVIGLAIGLLIGPTIRRWGAFWERCRYWLEWCFALLSLIWDCRPGIRRVANGFARIFAHERSKIVQSSSPMHLDTVRLEWTPKHKVYIRYDRQDEIMIFREDTESKEELLIIYEVWGRKMFWATLRKWREMDAVRQHLEFKKMRRAQIEMKPSRVREP